MRIYAWFVGRVWSQWHILGFGRPLCGTPVPDVVQAQFDREVRPSDAPHICQKCRQLAIARALEEKPADRGEAVDGPNGLTGAAGPVELESITAGRERANA